MEWAVLVCVVSVINQLDLLHIFLFGLVEVGISGINDNSNGAGLGDWLRVCVQLLDGLKLVFGSEWHIKYKWAVKQNWLKRWHLKMSFVTLIEPFHLFKKWGLFLMGLSARVQKFDDGYYWLFLRAPTEPNDKFILKLLSI